MQMSLKYLFFSCFFQFFQFIDANMVTLNSLCIITEYCAKGALNKYLQTNQLSNSDILQIMQGIAAGMRHLAKEKIIHRDLAARNVLLANDLTPKVTEKYALK